MCTGSICLIVAIKEKPDASMADFNKDTINTKIHVELNNLRKLSVNRLYPALTHAL